MVDFRASTEESREIRSERISSASGDVARVERGTVAARAAVVWRRRDLRETILSVWYRVVCEKIEICVKLRASVKMKETRY